MTNTQTRSRRRWLAPLAAVAATAAIALTGGRLAVAGDDLAPRTAAELLADLQRARLDQLSGTVVQTADLGLPSLPIAGPKGTASLDGALAQVFSLASGSHTWRVWYGGQDRQRLALITSLGESDVIHNGQDLWLWSSSERSASHLKLPADPAAKARTAAAATGLPRTPEEAARLAIEAIDPTTRAEVGPAVQVAGRTAYELLLTPKDGTTLVRQVRVAVDGERKLPLRVQVYSTKLATPAVEVGFTSIDFSAPEARQFEFTPPPGTTVTQVSAEQLVSMAGDGKPPATAGADVTRAVRFAGAGWSRVLVAKLPDGQAVPTAPATGATGERRGSADPMAGLLGGLTPVSGAWGSGRLFEGTLWSAVLTDDGRVAIGAVPPSALYAALAAG